MLSNRRPSASGSGAVYSTNSKPSVPIGLAGSASSSLGSLTAAMFDLHVELVSDVTIMPKPLQVPSRALELENFLPYRLSVLAQIVSESLHDLYAGPFGLSVTEWRGLGAPRPLPPPPPPRLGRGHRMDKGGGGRGGARPPEARRGGGEARPPPPPP